MTKSEGSNFRDVARTLAARLRISQPPTDEDLRALFLALEDIPFDLLSAAADHLYATRQGPWWPLPVEWRRAVDAVQQARYEAGQLRPALQDLPQTCCDVCDDTGWQPFTCLGRGRGAILAPPATERPRPIESCDRLTTHPWHTYVRACSCRPGNPRYQATHRHPPEKYAEDAA